MRPRILTMNAFRRLRTNRFIHAGACCFRRNFISHPHVAIIIRVLRSAYLFICYFLCVCGGVGKGAVCFFFYENFGDGHESTRTAYRPTLVCFDMIFTFARRVFSRCFSSSCGLNGRGARAHRLVRAVHAGRRPIRTRTEARVFRCISFLSCAMLT